MQEDAGGCRRMQEVRLPAQYLCIGLPNAHAIGQWLFGKLVEPLLLSACSM
jgi:hypothetical protein